MYPERDPRSTLSRPRLAVSRGPELDACSHGGSSIRAPRVRQLVANAEPYLAGRSDSGAP